MATRRGLSLLLASVERSGESLLASSSTIALSGARRSAESTLTLARSISSSPTSSTSSFSPFASSSPTARTYSERKLFAYPPHQVFDVVADVQHYDQFVPWCVRSTVLRVGGSGGGSGASGEESATTTTGDGDDGERDSSSSSSTPPSTSEGALQLDAELEVGFRNFSERYTSNVTLKPFTIVDTTASGSALFRQLDCRWRFADGPLPTKTTWVDFAVSFEFRSAVHRHLASAFFDDVVARMVRAFEGRCAELYGAPSVGRRTKVVAGVTAARRRATASSSSVEEEDEGKLPA